MQALKTSPRTEVAVASPIQSARAGHAGHHGQAASLRRLVAWLLLCTLVWSMAGCSLPSLNGRSTSTALSVEESQQTPLGQLVVQGMQQHPGKAGLYLLTDPHEAFAVRIDLSQKAQKTLDIQYYIWRGDITGQLMLDALKDAADRGVRVRLLLDDLGSSQLDDELYVLDMHPQIEIRLFNPFVFRPFKPLGFVTDFSRANRRMHNKSFTADNAATVVGGRNVGDEYFGATDGVLFADLDVLVLGPVVQDVSDSFDAYWASDSSYPVSFVIKPPSDRKLANLRERARIVERSPEGAVYKGIASEATVMNRLLEQRLPMRWAATKLVVDDPAKGLGQAAEKELITHHMARMMGSPERTLDLVSPYFVPTDRGVDYFVGLAEQGVDIRILTNSLAATDVLAVHSGYARHRKRLLEAGIALFELKPDLNVSNGFSAVNSFMGSSGSSLHAKTFSIDSERLFVGSFNFDPRSAMLNTELGVVIDSPALVANMNELFLKEIPQRSWVLTLSEDKGQLQWLDFAEQPKMVLTTEPMSRWNQRLAVQLLSWLPIDWLL